MTTARASRSASTSTIRSFRSRPPLAIASESVARRPFGQPVVDPRLQRAQLVWLDVALVRFADLVAVVVEAAETLGGHEAAAHLVDAAETALRAIDWPSTTADYIARVAPAPSQQALWRRPETKPDPAPLNDAERASIAPQTPRCARGSPSCGAAFRRRATWR